ncbi:MAG: hypothetical protein IPP78_04390 [Holophagaceae bacterium]|nr:hypothetical protein [Holophagaceae bacterium]
MRIALNPFPLIAKDFFASFSLGGILTNSATTITTTTTTTAFGARPV